MTARQTTGRAEIRSTRKGAAHLARSRLPPSATLESARTRAPTRYRKPEPPLPTSRHLHPEMPRSKQGPGSKRVKSTLSQATKPSPPGPESGICTAQPRKNATVHKDIVILVDMVY